MKLLIVLSALAAVAFSRPEGDFYDSKYDNFDIDTLINNHRLLKAYTLCMLGKGSCTGEGTTFKKVLPEAVATTCGKCTPKQRSHVRTVIRALQKQFPQEWQELVKLHDPEGKYRESFGKFLNGSD